MTPKQKAYQNSLKRPIKTSKLNPYAMRKSYGDEIRVSPRLDVLAKQARASGVAAKAPQHSLRTLAEDKAYYTSDRQDARATAASMLRGYRKTKLLSAQDAANLVEFAGGYPNPLKIAKSEGLRGNALAAKASQLRAKFKGQAKYQARKQAAARQGAAHPDDRLAQDIRACSGAASRETRSRCIS